MAEECVEDIPPPEIRYELLNKFDLDSYDQDLGSFPESFDGNGWPLYGEYDPYTLTHPITGVSWHLSPRVPSTDETDQFYERWFELAETYNTAIANLIDFRLTNQSRSLENTTESNLRFRTGAESSVYGGINYLQQNVLQQLNQLLAIRSNSPELTLLWGELLIVYERLLPSLTEEPRRRGRKKGSKTNSKDAQLKWYLHWRRYAEDELGLSVRVLNQRFVDYCFGIHEGRVCLPNGFKKIWFEDALGRESYEDGKIASPIRALPDILKRSKKCALKGKLLNSAADDDPRIPSLLPINRVFNEGA
ncbi:MAG: hypothetical protein ABJN04_11190 [Hyphomicrobiales bacterium]